MIFYYLLGRLLHPAMAVAAFIYNKLTDTPRARVVVLNEHSEILLVRNWAGSTQWELPGGGVGRHERPQEAAHRELLEETGIDVSFDDFRYIATFRIKYEAPIYLVRIAKDALPAVRYNPKEITHIAWFPVSQLPAKVSPLTRAALAKLAL